MRALIAVLIRDMRIAVRVGGGALMGVLFFLVVVTLTPFALGPDQALLGGIGPGHLLPGSGHTIRTHVWRRSGFVGVLKGCF